MSDEIREAERAKQKERILELLPKNRYHITNACKSVGIHRNTFTNWLNSDKDFLERYQAVKEQKMDDAEERLYLIAYGIPKVNDEGKLTGWEEKPHYGALLGLLKAQAKDRGYGDHIVIDDKREDDDPREKTDEELLAEMERITKRAGIND